MSTVSAPTVVGLLVLALLTVASLAAAVAARRTAADARGLAGLARTDAASTRHAAEETLRRVADTAPVPYTPQPYTAQLRVVGDRR